MKKYITHYTKLYTLLNHILEKNEFRLNSLSQTNDPFEYKKRYSSIISSNEIDDQIHSKIDEIINKCIKVGCFVDESIENTEDFTDLQSTKNAPLWAHYGDNQNGVAIVFDKDKFIETCKEIVDFDWAIKNNLIEYKKSLELNEKDPNSINLDLIDCSNDLDIAKHVFSKAKDFWFNKELKWSYEDEYRIMLYTNSKEPEFIDISKCINAIVFGENISDFLLEAISPKCKGMGITCLTIKFDEFLNKFSCEVV